MIKKRLRKPLVRAAVKILFNRGKLTQEESDEILKRLDEMDWEEFFEWFLEHWPEILEMLMMFMMFI